MKKKGMTLVETVIVVVIIGMLSTILVKSYIQMSQIAFRVEQEKNVTQEMLLLSEVLQNYSDRNSLDYKKYESEELISKEGLVDTLYLTGLDGSVKITTDGDGCLEPGESIVIEEEDETIIKEGDCRVTIKQDDKEFNITNPKKVRVTQLRFKIIPYATSEDYFGNEDETLCETNYLACVHQPGFRLLGKAYSTHYGTQRASNIIIPVQQFFSLQ